LDETSRLKWTLFARNVVLLTLAIIGGYWIGGDRYHFTFGPMDYLATGAFILLLSWLLLPNIRLNGSHLDDASDGFALRLGKATKRGLRRLKLRP
jgi:hypothetical protein